MIPLSLFSSELSNTEKEEIAKLLLIHKPTKPLKCPSNCYGARFGKPCFPINQNASITSSELITEDSWFFVEIMQIDDMFLHENAGNWSKINSYQ